MINPTLAHTERTRLDNAFDFLIALAPVLIWSVFMFGARALTLSAVSVLFCFAFDFPVQRFLLRLPVSSCFDPMNAVYGLLAAFMMPVSVSLFIPVLGAAICVLGKNLRLIHGCWLFNPFVLSAAALNLIFPTAMTAFTRPFAYFNAFTPVLDGALVERYRVLSPLQYMADGSVYEDGVMAQFYGYASGCIGEIATAAIILGAIWLLIRKRADLRGTFGFIAVIAILASIFPSDDAETNYYVYSVLLSGGIILMSVYGMNEPQTVPDTKLGKWLFGAVCGALTFVFRRTLAGTESAYYSILLMNILSPFISRLTRARPFGASSGRRVKA